MSTTGLADPPFRADHVGSLLRPPALIAARRRRSEGASSDGELRAAEDAAITEVVAMQERVGLQAATDGEFRRTSWHMDFIYQLGGIERTTDLLEVRMRNASGSTAFSSAGLAVTGRVRLERPIFAEAFGYLASQTTSALPKLTIPSPRHCSAGWTSTDSSASSTTSAPGASRHCGSCRPANGWFSGWSPRNAASSSPVTS